MHNRESRGCAYGCRNFHAYPKCWLQHFQTTVTLRHMHETSNQQVSFDISCPTLEAALAAAIEAHAARCMPLAGSTYSGSSGGGAALAFLLDLAELADVAGCSKMSIILDMRKHEGKALLHPRMAKYQGG